MSRVWVNGELRDAADASVAALDHGLTVGDGVFETMRVYDGAPFALRRHLDRLERSAAGLGLDLPGRSLLERAVHDVIAASPLVDARVRLTVTGGPGPLGSGRSDGNPTVIAAVGQLEPASPATAVITVPWVRNERSAVAGLKTTSYAENVVALAHAKTAGASEALFANTVGDLCEGTGSNVFLVLDDRLVTPPLSSGCLAGVTRELVLEVVDVLERSVPFTALDHADEVFLTSSTREVQAVTRIDGRQLPAGPRTAAAVAAFAALRRRSLDP